MGKKVILYMNVSLDGFIADRDGKISWKGGESEFYQGDYGKSGFLSVVDTIIMGRDTYNRLIKKYGTERWPYKDKVTYVITHRPLEDTEYFKFVDSRLSSLINELKDKPGEAIWIFGGADIANQAVRDNLIDEYHLVIHPIILGSGKKLFDDHNKTIKLHLVRNGNKNGVMDCLYERI